ncbi:hypothetical protein NBT05_05615 [Aquimarina sp. ERC-38]|uniref:hypothetical protein n=1 Tax=Aquimarina sp. ERC-38 TaxID=2949996 RepID=UPI00224571B3|nr:hypothetical protein [Aquimarina sp. ERC-38]UZO81942.1 hypothetical protein NBT05_05615 [Aquimarina sp. ERC-38]
MIRTFYILFTFITLSIISCSKDEELTPETFAEEEENEEQFEQDQEIENDSIVFFTVKVNPYYLGDLIASTYIIINDANGNLINHTMVQNNKTYEFKVKKGEGFDKFTVSKFDNIIRPNYQYSSLNTFFHIDQGTVWNFNGASQNLTLDNSNFKTFSLKVENVKDYNSYELSSPINNSYPGYENSGTINFDNVEFIENETKLLLTIHFTTEKSKYVYIDNIIEGEERVIDAADLKNFDSYVPIDLPTDNKNFSKLLSFNVGNSGVYTTSSFFGTEISSIRNANFGILPEFENFTVRINRSNLDENYRYQYYQSAKILKEISVSSFGKNFQVSNENRESFLFTSDFTYDTKYSSWIYSKQEDSNYEYAVWNFHSNTENYTKVPVLPKEFLEMYTNFDISKLKYDSTKLIKTNEPYSFFTTNTNDNDFTEVLREDIIFFKPVTKNKLFKSKKFEEEFKLLGERLLR